MLIYLVYLEVGIYKLYINNSYQILLTVLEDHERLFLEKLPVL